jgi:hypothetical protein
MCNHINVDEDGIVGAAWTMAFDLANGYADRGSGYNTNAGGLWGSIPTDRLEQVRTGWTNYVKTSPGTEFIIGNDFSTGKLRLHTSRRDADETDWAEGSIPTYTAAGIAWPRMAVDGDDIHVIAAAPGAVYYGVRHHILYYRSSDGGISWNKIDFLIPGLDSTHTKDLFIPDCYAIDARDGKVAIGVFPPFADILVFVSENGGNTWEKIRIRDFPIDGYLFDDGISEDDLPPWDSTFSPNPLAVYSTDGSANVLIDRDGKVHAFITDFFIGDPTAGDGSFSFWLTNSLSYWNSDFGPDSTRIITRAEDLNDNGELDVNSYSEVAAYSAWKGTTLDYPSAGVDSYNNLYLSYSSLMEGEDMFFNEDDQQHYWHIYLMASEDGGESWTEPFDMINEEISEAGPAFAEVEAAFPCMAKKVDDQIHLIYQRSEHPGIAFNGDFDPAENNEIIYAAIDVAELGITVGATRAMEKRFSWDLYPNPATDQVFVEFELEQGANVKMEIVNLMGTILQSQSLGKLETGYHQQKIGLNTLPPGLYVLRINLDGEIEGRKLLIQ